MSYEEDALRSLMCSMWGPRSQMSRSMEKSSHGELFLLRELMISGGSTPSQLAASMHVTTGRISTMLNSLIKKGWVTRTEDPKDRRKVRVEITEAGWKIIDEHGKAMREHIYWIFRQMGETKTRELVSLLEEFSAYMAICEPGKPHPNQDEIQQAIEERRRQAEEMQKNAESFFEHAGQPNRSDQTGQSGVPDQSSEPSEPSGSGQPDQPNQSGQSPHPIHPFHPPIPGFPPDFTQE